MHEHFYPITCDKNGEHQPGVSGSDGMSSINADREPLDY